MKMAQVDSFSNHDSHDIDFEVELDADPDQNGLLSFNDELGVEWHGQGSHPPHHRRQRLRRRRAEVSRRGYLTIGRLKRTSHV